MTIVSWSLRLAGIFLEAIADVIGGAGDLLQEYADRV